MWKAGTWITWRLNYPKYDRFDSEMNERPCVVQNERLAAVNPGFAWRADVETLIGPSVLSRTGQNQLFQLMIDMGEYFRV